MIKQEEGNKYWKILSISFFIIFVVVLFFSAYYLSTSQKKSDKIPLNIIKGNIYSKKEEKENKCINCKRKLIDGTYTKDNYNLYPFAFVIDNNIAARPAHGLSQAKLVYEVEVEGGITRYLALFDTDSDFEKIGLIPEFEI
jgi:hypothetical protein